MTLSMRVAVNPAVNRINHEHIHCVNIAKKINIHKTVIYTQIQ